MQTDYVAQLRESLLGLECRVERHDPDWFLRFAPDIWFVISCPWRVVAEGGIAFADEDHGQYFGLSQPVDGEERSNELLDGARVVDASISVETADVLIKLERGLRIEVFNNSSGYEGWNVSYPDPNGAGEVRLIGLGGGDIAISPPVAAVGDQA
jgi:hypothetical protein